MFVSRRFANCVYAALQPIPVSHLRVRRLPTDTPAFLCAGKLFALTHPSNGKTQQPLDFIAIYDQSPRKTPSSRIPEISLPDKRKPSGTRTFYHSAFRFGMQLAFLTIELT
jgi:hypothetical protein